MLEKKSLLMTACAQGTSQLVAQFLKHNADVNQKDEKNRNCMFHVLDNKKKQQALQIMKLLLDRHPDLRNSTASLNSILIAALEKNKPDLAKLLLERGADPNQATLDSSKPLGYSQRKHRCIWRSEP